MNAKKHLPQRRTTAYRTPPAPGSPAGHGPIPRAATRIGLGLAALGSAVAAYRFALHPWQRHWGATRSEIARALPGDALVPNPAYESTRAIEIKAPAEVVWQWLVQIGQDRAGFYSYEWLENLVGADIHNADEVVPQWQTLHVGDTVRFAPEDRFGWDARATVLALEPKRALVLGPTPGDAETNRAAALTGAGTWAFILDPIDAQTTRLIIRTRSHTWKAPRIFFWLYDPAHFIMERKMLLGIKERAERAGQMQAT